MTILRSAKHDWLNEQVSTGENTVISWVLVLFIVDDNERVSNSDCETTQNSDPCNQEHTPNVEAVVGINYSWHYECHWTKLNPILE